MKWSNKSLIVIVGPTAVGKTATAIRIAQYFNTEIISADSRQIYKELNIGTAKPTTQELKLVQHHFINTHSIQEDYDAAQYGEEALELVYRLFESHDYVVVCGGSGLYVKALLEGFDDIPEVPDAIREELVLQYETQGLLWLQQKVKALDPDHFKNIDQQNPHRLIRALEVKIGTGKSISAFQKKQKKEHPFAVIKIGLELPREQLYHRIDTRMDKMIEDGLFEEAESLVSFKNKNALQTVGYQEIYDYLNGDYDRDEAIRLLKRNSRRYAKRQLTWFKRDDSINWFSPEDIDNIVDSIKVFSREIKSENKS